MLYLKKSKTISRTIERVDYDVLLYDESADAVVHDTYTDIDSIPENDLKRALNAQLSDEGSPLTVLKLKPMNANVYLVTNTTRDFFESGEKVIKV